MAGAFNPGQPGSSDGDQTELRLKLSGKVSEKNSQKLSKSSPRLESSCLDLPLERRYNSLQTCSDGDRIPPRPLA
jgi:hypothetical protein